MNTTQKDFSLSISQVVQMLSLDNKNWEDFSCTILNSYKSSMDRKLKKFINNPLIKNDIRKDIMKHLSLLPKQKHFQFVTSPSVTKITRFDHDSKAISTLGKQLLAYAAAENTSLGSATYTESWTANGDFILFETEEAEYSEYRSFTLLDLIPLNFHSSQAASLTKKEIAEPDSSNIKLYSIEEAEEVTEILDGSVMPIREDRMYTSFIKNFTSFIILTKVIPENMQLKYFSGSDAENVGRTVLSNIHVASKEVIIESIFHEAIHSMLYMIDNISQWQPNYDNYSQAKGRFITSFWSGNQLTIHSFLQACFVWFGIFFFWKQQLGKERYSHEFIVERLGFIKKGFGKLSLNNIKSHFPSLMKDTEDSIYKMRQQVLSV